MSIINKKPAQENPLVTMKVIFMGDPSVGKTSLLCREYDDSFNE